MTHIITWIIHHFKCRNIFAFWNSYFGNRLKNISCKGPQVEFVWAVEFILGVWASNRFVLAVSICSIQGVYIIAGFWGGLVWHKVEVCGKLRAGNQTVVPESLLKTNTALLSPECRLFQCVGFLFETRWVHWTIFTGD